MFSNPLIVVPLAVWVIAQALKFTLGAFRGRVDFKYLYASGGMPSAHSAVVAALATTAYFTAGSASPVFGLSIIFAAIVMYDSFGVRRASGEQAAAINMLIDSLNLDRIKIRNNTRLREMLGHQPLEVVAGAILGAALSCLFNLSHLTPQLNWLATIPGRLEWKVYLVLALILLVGGLTVRQWLKRRYQNSRAMAGLTKHLFGMTLTISLVSLVLIFAQYEKLSYFSWRAWVVVVALAFIGWSWWIFDRFRRDLPQALAAEAEDARRQKWLVPKRKQKRA